MALTSVREYVLTKVLPLVTPSSYEPRQKENDPPKTPQGIKFHQLAPGWKPPTQEQIDKKLSIETSCGYLPGFVALRIGAKGLANNGLNGLRTAAKNAKNWKKPDESPWIVPAAGLLNALGNVRKNLSAAFRGYMAGKDPVDFSDPKWLLEQQRKNWQLPKPGDLYALCQGTDPNGLIEHVGVIVDATTDPFMWITADAGQGKVPDQFAHDRIYRRYYPATGQLSGPLAESQSVNPYDKPPRRVAGWVDIDKIKSNFP